MRILAIDYGTKYLGIALSDASGKVAIPYGIILNTETAIEEISVFCKKNNIESIVVGIPVSFDCKEHASARAARMFGEKVASGISLPVSFANEMLTTKMAKAYSARSKKRVDDKAAAIFLQAYLDNAQNQDAGGNEV